MAGMLVAPDRLSPPAGPLSEMEDQADSEHRLDGLACHGDTQKEDPCGRELAAMQKEGRQERDRDERQRGEKDHRGEQSCPPEREERTGRQGASRSPETRESGASDPSHRALAARLRRRTAGGGA